MAKLSIDVWDEEQHRLISTCVDWEKNKDSKADLAYKIAKAIFDAVLDSNLPFNYDLSEDSDS